MACYYPLRAYKSGRLPNGKLAIVWKKSEAKGVGQALDLPCGQCIGCRLERSRQWAVRCVHEASLYADNCFVTLTYDEGHLPRGGSLVLEHFQLFMKRLRKKFGSGVRFFHCGEYGEICARCRNGRKVCGCSDPVWVLGRPHYHAILFNLDFADKVPIKESNGNVLYASACLSRLWGHGLCSIGAVTFESAGYVARYALKKVHGEKADAWYQGRKKEYVTMSRGCKSLGTGGIGKGWYDKFKSEVFPRDEVVVRGVVTRPPRFYDGLLDREDSGVLERVKRKRISRIPKAYLAEGAGYKGKVLIDEMSSDRLHVKALVKDAQIKSLKRDLGE